MSLNISKMKRLVEFLKQQLAGKKVLGLFVLTNVVYLVILKITIPKTMGYANDMKLLDMMPTGYDFEYVNKLFTALGREGRDVYLTVQLPVDIFYPLLFGITYTLILAYFLNKLKKLSSPYVFLCLLPILAGVSDYLENIGIITMLNRFPDISRTSVVVTNIFTLIKSISTSVYFLILIIVMIAFGIKILKNKQTKNEVIN